MKQVEDLEVLLKKSDIVTQYSNVFIDALKRGPIKFTGHVLIAQCLCKDVNFRDYQLVSRFLMPNQPIDKYSWSRQTHHLYAGKIRNLIEKVYMVFYYSCGKDVCDLIAKQVVFLEFDACQPDNILPLPKSLCNVLTIVDMLETCVKSMVVEKNELETEPCFQSVEKPVFLFPKRATKDCNSYNAVEILFKRTCYLDCDFNLEVVLFGSNTIRSDHFTAQIQIYISN